MFALALLMIAFGLGYITTVRQVFPFQLIDGAVKTTGVVINHFTDIDGSDFLTYTKIPADMAAAQRITSVAASGGENLLITGGPKRFLEYCPGTGCLAVMLDRQGRLVHAYPFRPAAFHKGDIANLPYQQPFMSPETDLNPFGLVQLPGGDLIATFYNDKAFPFGAGVARIAMDGRVVWYRRDYTHHWPALLPGGEIAVTSAEISTRPVYRDLGGGKVLVTGCRVGYLRDTIHLLDTGGRVRETFQVFDAVVESRFRALLLQANAPFRKFADSCDPLHTNYVRAVGAEIAAKFSDVTADDLLVSMRNISAVGILDRQSRKFTHIFRGSFHFQHGAQPITGGRIIVFDDLGATADVGPSRVLAFDPATGQETIIFPGPKTPPGTPMSTVVAGNIDVSADGRRALVAVTEGEASYEIDIQTGEILTRLDHLHDLRSLRLKTGGQDAMAARFKQNGVYYQTAAEVVSRDRVAPPKPTAP